MKENLTPNGDNQTVSASARFVLAAVCCGVFVVTVVMFAHLTSTAPRAALRDVSLTFWGIVVNFALCLGTVAYVSRRLHKARIARANAQ